jgi:Predicted amino acid aldolase or racemase
MSGTKRYTTPIDRVGAIRSALESSGIEIPLVIAGGTPTFPQFAELSDFSLSPGTAFLHDSGYASNFRDLELRPAAWVLGRVVSRRDAETITIDVGTKSIATDPKGARGYFPELKQPEVLIHNEEHWVIRDPSTKAFGIGDTIRVIPTHICPTVNLYNRLHLLRREGGVDLWPVDARDRYVPSWGV